MDVSNRLALPYLAAAQSQKHVTHNEALRMLDTLVQAGVLQSGVQAPPDTPAEGDRYLVGVAPLGAFAGHAGQLAAFDDGSWRFHQPRPGWLCYVAAAGAVLLYDGTSWRDLASALTALAGLTSFALGTGADPGNPFSAKLNDALFSARGAGEGGSGSLRLKLNKEKEASTASILFQDGWSGRAEAGLCGDDRFRIKVSADGAAWRDGLLVDAQTGAVTFPSGVGGFGGSGVGDLRNHVINGDFMIAQRGAGPFPLGQAPAYGPDRWFTQAAGVAAGQLSCSAFAAGQADVPGGRCFATLSVASTTATSFPELQTRLEDVTRLAGRKVTVSFSYRTASAAFFCDMAQVFGAGGSAAVSGLASTALAASPAWTRRVITTTLPGVSGKTVAAGSCTALRFALSGSSAASIDIADVQLEEGPAASAFARRMPAVELLLARRYFRRSAAAQSPADLAFEMRTTPVASGAGPFDYSAEL
ncbi:MAG: DUF2793 domain-containing protein [Alsobacter sp.]